MFPISLDRPLIVFDIEATGISPRADRIIELAAVRFDPDGTETRQCWLINPEMPIPVESIAIHGISDADVADAPTFAKLALEIYTFFGPDSDLSGFAADRFDIPILSEEFNRVGIAFHPEGRRVLDAQRIFHTREPRDLSAAVRFYCGHELEDAHSAEADVDATIEVIRGQFERYTDLPQTIESFDETFNPRDPFNVDRAGRLRWQDGEIIVNFGKKKGEKLAKLAKEEPSFLKWIIKNDFPVDTRKLCEDALKGFFPEPPKARIKFEG